LDLAKLQASIDAVDRANQTIFQDWQLISQALAPMVIENGLRVVGISGSQGSGKSTLAQYLVEEIVALGVEAVAVSLDDFYLTKQQRRELGETVHPLLQTRGVPGTHDTQLLRRCLDSITAAPVDVANKSPVELTLPSFDKGLDDRAGFARVQASVLIIEGWCVGVEPQPESLLERAINSLEKVEDSSLSWRRWVNQQIHQHYSPLWSYVDYWVQLRAPSFEQVHQWRGQQETRLPELQRMSRAQLTRFIEHYERLTRWQWQSADLQPGLKVALADNHSVRSVAVS